MSIKIKMFKDKLFYSNKNRSNTKTFIASIASILIALIVALLVATMMGYDPIYVVSKLFTVGFSDGKQLFNYIGIYVLAAFAFCITSKAGVFNIGISGQMLASGTVIVFVIQIMQHFGIASSIPNGVGQILILLIAIVVGSLVSLFVGSLSVYLKVNSVVSAILLNWIIYFVSFYLLVTSWDSIGYSPTISGNYIVGSATIPDNFRFIDTTTNTGAIIPIIVIILTIGITILVLFKFTVFGHKINSIGLSEEASKYAGYNTNKIKLMVFAISGSIAGILACINYTTGSIPMIPLNTSLDSIPTEGFDGIAISLIANNNPIGIIAIGSLFGLFKNSMVGITIPPSYFNVLIGLIMLGATLSILLYRFKPWLYLKSLKYKKDIYLIKDKLNNDLSNNAYEYYELIMKSKSIPKIELNSIYRKYLESKKSYINAYQFEKIILYINNKLSFNEIYNSTYNKIYLENNKRYSKKIIKLEEKKREIENHIKHNKNKHHNDELMKKIEGIQSKIYDVINISNISFDHEWIKAKNKIEKNQLSKNYIDKHIQYIDNKIMKLNNQEDANKLKEYLNSIINSQINNKEVI